METRLILQVEIIFNGKKGKGIDAVNLVADALDLMEDADIQYLIEVKKA